MEAWILKGLTKKPAAGDTINIYNADTTDHVTGLVDLSNNAFDSPYTVPVGKEDEWGFVPPDGVSYDVYWVEGATYLSKKQGGKQGTAGSPILTANGFLGGLTLVTEIKDNDEVFVYKAGTNILIARLEDKDGNSVTNPYTISDASNWGIKIPYACEVDVKINDTTTIIDGQRLKAGINRYTVEPTYVAPDEFYEIALTITGLSWDGTSLTVTISSAVDVSLLTSVGDGTGNVELYDKTNAAWRTLSINHSLNPIIVLTPSGMVDNAYHELYLSTNITNVAGDTALDGVDVAFTNGTIVPDTTAPTGESVTIDEGAAISTLSVNLTLSATDDVAVTQMMIANSNDFAGASWETYNTSKAWTLAAGGDGARTVYAKFRDAAGNESGVASDTTTYTEPVNTAPTAPVISLSSVGSGSAVIAFDTLSTDVEDGAISTYNVYVDGVYDSQATGIALAGDTHAITGLTNGVQVAITAKAVDSILAESVSSNTVNATPVNAAPVFDSQPTESSKTSDSVTLIYSSSDTEADNYLLESSTDNGATWQTEVAEETAGAGKTVTINTISSDGVTALSASTEYTFLLRMTALTGNTTPVTSQSVVVTTDAAAPTNTIRFGVSLYGAGGTATLTAGGSEVFAIPAGYTGIGAATFDTDENSNSLSGGNLVATGTPVWKSSLLQDVAADKIYVEVVTNSGNTNFCIGAAISGQGVDASYLGIDLNGWCLNRYNNHKYHGGDQGVATMLHDGSTLTHYAVCIDKTAGKLWIAGCNDVAGHTGQQIIDPTVDTPLYTGVTV